MVPRERVLRHEWGPTNAPLRLDNFQFAVGFESANLRKNYACSYGSCNLRLFHRMSKSSYERVAKLVDSLLIVERNLGLKSCDLRVPQGGSQEGIASGVDLLAVEERIVFEHAVNGVQWSAYHSNRGLHSGFAGLDGVQAGVA